MKWVAYFTITLLWCELLGQFLFFDTGRIENGLIFLEISEIIVEIGLFLGIIMEI